MNGFQLRLIFGIKLQERNGLNLLHSNKLHLLSAPGAAAGPSTNTAAPRAQTTAVKFVRKDISNHSESCLTVRCCSVSALDRNTFKRLP